VWRTVLRTMRDSLVHPRNTLVWRRHIGGIDHQAAKAKRVAARNSVFPARERPQHRRPQAAQR
jgi:hypothetical protein